MWLYGNGEENDRPDKSGVMVDNAIPVHGALRAIPVRKGAADSAEGMAAITNISRDRDQPVLVCAFPETRLVRIVGRGVE